LVERLEGAAPCRLAVERQPLKGGNDASEVTLVTARFEAPPGRPKSRRFVVKRLDGRAAREAAVYEALVTLYASEASPHCLAVEHVPPDRVWLVIEALRRINGWPWREIGRAGVLLERLARFHIAAEGAAAAVPPWDYETELYASAVATREVLDQCGTDPDLAPLGRHVRSLDRLVLA
jgi:hypothetical protein